MGRKAVIAGVLVTGAVVGGIYAARKGKQIKDGIGSISAKIGNIYGLRLAGNGIFGGLEFKADMDIANPSDLALSINLDSFTAFVDTTELAMTGASNASVEIPAKGNGTIKGIKINLPYQNALMILGANMADLKKGAAAIQSKISYRVDLRVNGVKVVVNMKTGAETDVAISGLGLTAGKRNIKDGSAFNHLFPGVGTEYRFPAGTPDDTVAKMADLVDRHYQEAMPLFKYLGSPHDVKAFCGRLFSFCYQHMQYENDPMGTEVLRSPARSWHVGQHLALQNRSAGIDCDDFSTFVGCVLKCAGIPFKFRITKYDGRSYFQHVYVVVPIEGNGEIIIDPVLDQFDYQKPFSGVKDFTSAGQVLSGLSGLEGDPLDELKKRLKNISNATALNPRKYFNDSKDGAVYDWMQKKYIDLTAKVKGQRFRNMINSLLLHWPEKSPALAGLGALDDLVSQADYLAGLEQRMEAAGYLELGDLGKGFFSEIGSGLKKLANKAGGVLKQGAHALNKVNPVFVAARTGLLAMLKNNHKGMSTKLAPHYASDKSKYKPDEIARASKAAEKIESQFSFWGGARSNIGKSVRQGAGISGLSGLGDLGFAPVLLSFIEPILKMLGIGGKGGDKSAAASAPAMSASAPAPAAESAEAAEPSSSTPARKGRSAAPDMSASAPGGTQDTPPGGNKWSIGKKIGIFGGGALLLGLIGWGVSRAVK